VQLDAIAGTVVATKLGERYGCLSASLDMLKVAAPTLAFRLAHPDAPYFLIAAALGVVGRDRPLYYRFKGGRGLSAIYGGFLVIDPIGTLFTSLVALLVGLLMKNILVSYLAGTWLMIPWFWFRTADPAYLAYVVAVNIMFMLVLIPEISLMRDRQRRGVEVDFDAALEATPMGRGLKKLATRLGLSHSGQ
jgi:glycerol-3-phosphate acyltransferase PlsY